MVHTQYKKKNAYTPLSSHVSTEWNTELQYDQNYSLYPDIIVYEVE